MHGCDNKLGFVVHDDVLKGLYQGLAILISGL